MPIRALRYSFALALCLTLFSTESEGKICSFNSKILASANPFGSCPIGTDTILIRDTFVVDISYEPLIGGVPFDGKFIIDGGVILWSSSAKFTLGSNARILLFNGGRLYPGTTFDIGCNGLRTIFFDMFKLASCDGTNALHSFADINAAGCFDAAGICCDAAITVKENSGNPNDNTLCSPGDSVTLSVLGSGNLMYDFMWSPNLGPDRGPYKVAQFVTTTYSIGITAIFDPTGPTPPYLLSCGSSVQVRINPTINLSTTTTPVPCASALVGLVNLTVSGGTAPYKYLWSNSRTTEDINGLVAGTYTVTVTDARGCSRITSATVATVDNIPPTLACPPNANGVANLNQCTTLIPNIDAVFSDNCPAAQLSYVVTGATNASGIGQLSNNLPFQAGINTVEYRVSDGSNVVSCQFVVNVADTQAPTASNPTDMVGVQCYGDIPLPDPAVVTTEADNCGTPSVVFLSESAIGGSSCPGNPLIVSRIYRVIDAFGNSATVTQTILVADSTPPVFTGIPADITVSCGTIPAVGAVMASDNCRAPVDITYLGQTRTDGPCTDTYTLTRTWQARDNCGNTAIASQIISVQDVIAPVFTLIPANVTVDCQSIPSAGNPVATDNCDNAVTITFVGEIRTDGACPGSYSLLRTWRAADNCGNESLGDQIITVQDVSNPTFASIPANITVSCESIPAADNPVAADNCDPAVVIAYEGQTRTNGACTEAYTLLRTWRATDFCGNSATATQLITVLDLTPPTFTDVPANATVSCDAIPVVGVAVASDNCAANVTITFNSEMRTNGSCPNSYLLTRTWTAEDNCGNTQTASQVLTVTDITSPVFLTTPANLTVSCDALPTIGTPTASDNCSANVTIQYVSEAREDGTCLDSYLLRRRWVATDECGNTATTEQIVTVRDQTAPVYTFVPADLTVSCDAIPPVGNPTATDNCDASVTITYTGEVLVPSICAFRYTLIRNWSATDNCGNVRVATQNIVVQDITSPVFSSVPAAVTANCDALPPVGNPTATDNCDPNVLITYLGDSVPGSGGACPGNYEIVRTWSAQDACGNSATATQVITVQDITAPVILTVPADEVVDCANIPTVGTPTASDNCDATPSFVYNGAIRIDGACANSYTLIRQWTVSDDCGNTSTATQTLTVQDVTAPAFTFVPDAITVNCDNIPSVGTPLAADDCAVSVQITYLGQTRVDGACADAYTLTRSWVAADSCGNTASASQVITVQDITAPIFASVPAPVTVNCESIPAAGTPTATDNCAAAVSIQYLGEVRTDGSCANRYTLLRSWEALDNCGNTSVASQLITVRDTMAPVFTFVPVNVTVNCDMLPPVGTPVATDNCSANVTITYLGEARTDGNCPGNYLLKRVWAAQDECVNTKIVTQEIQVRDVTSPILTFVPANATVSCDAVPPVENPTATDNCDPNPSIVFNGTVRTNGNCPHTYTLTRSWAISDNCGNTTRAIQILEVEDTTPPIFTSVPAGLTASCESIPPVVTPTAQDNCAVSVNITYDGEVRTDGACPDTYTLTRTWTAVDSCANAVTTQQIIQVQDITPPNFTIIPADAVVNCDAIPAVTFPVATDNCDAFVGITYVGETRIDGNCPNSYLLRREWVATDNCGNTAQAIQNLNVQDSTPPQFMGVPANVTVSCETVPVVGTPTASDNCDADVSIVFSGEVRTDGNCLNNYTLRRSWIATDDCGNTQTAFQIITVEDLTPPVFTFVPADSTVNCDAIPMPGTPTATDNCSSSPTIVLVGETITNSNSLDSYALVRTWTATDECNNVSTGIQTLTVQDTIAPSIQCPADVVVDADGATCLGTATFSMPITQDNCSANLQVVSSSNSGDLFPIGVSSVTMTVTDPTGNAASCSFQVIVRDTTPPVLLNCPSDLTFTTDVLTCETTVTWVAPSVTDPCDQYSIFPTVNIPIDTVLPTGIHTVIYTAVDTSGNIAQCSFTVTVREDVAPVLANCPTDITVTTDSCFAPVSWITPLATDNCDFDTLVVNIASGSIFPETTTVVQYTASDDWGNTATCTFTVTVVDIVPPTFGGCPDDIVINTDSCIIPVSWVQPIATDNCNPDPTIFSVPAPGDLFSTGFTTVQVYVVDPSGNQDTCTFVVQVISPPIGLIDAPQNQSFIGCEAVATWTPPTPTGICGPFILTSNYEPGDTFGIGTTEVIYTLADTLNQVVTTTFTITVTESIAPELICPSALISVNISGAVLVDPTGFITGTDTLGSCDSVELQFNLPLATDNCTLNPLVEQTGGQTSSGVFGLGTNTLTFVATDEAGNTDLCLVQIQVLVLQPLNPQVSDVIACKGDEVTLSATPIAGAEYFWTGPNPPYEDNNNIVIPALDSTLTGFYYVSALINGCITPMDSALVRIGKKPITVDDIEYQVATNEILVNFNMLLNDTYETDDYVLVINNAPAGLFDHGNGLYSYQAGDENEVITFSYTLCSKACPDLCDEGVIAITVRERICMEVPNIITPNGDGLNDYLAIPCLDIEFYPDNQLVIYNQWGDKVYEAAPYSNDPAKAWQGELFGRAGQGLPDAAYYFFFKPTLDHPGIKGFVEVFR